MASNDSNKIKLIVSDQFYCFENTKLYLEDRLNKIIINEFKKQVANIDITLQIGDQNSICEESLGVIDIDLLGVFKKDALNDYKPSIEIYYNLIEIYCHFKGYTQEEFEVILLTVIIHELAHYYMFPAKIGDDIKKLKFANEPMHTKYYKDGCWYKTIEESLCNFIAYSQKWHAKEKKLIEEFFQNQPHDYKYALSLKKINKRALDIGREWKELKVHQYIGTEIHLDEFTNDTSLNFMEKYAHGIVNDSLEPNASLDMQTLLTIEDYNYIKYIEENGLSCVEISLEDYIKRAKLGKFAAWLDL